MVKTHVHLKEALQETRELESQLPKAKRHSARVKSERKKAIRAITAPKPKPRKRGQFHSLGLLADALSQVNTETPQFNSVPRLSKADRKSLVNDDAVRLQRIAQSQAFIANPMQAISQHLKYAYTAPRT